MSTEQIRIFDVSQAVDKYVDRYIDEHKKEEPYLGILGTPQGKKGWKKHLRRMARKQGLKTDSEIEYLVDSFFTRVLERNEEETRELIIKARIARGKP